MCLAVEAPLADGRPRWVGCALMGAEPGTAH
jgi:hypothetical protein